MSNKQYISAHELHVLSYKLAAQVAQSDWKPTFIVALWRGGSFIGICMQELLAWAGIKTDHIAIRTSAYEGQNMAREIKVHNLHYIVENCNSDDNLLIVDDVFDSGKSLQKVIDELHSKMRANYPNVRIATVYYKPQNNKTTIIPDYFCETSTSWLVFPHEVEDMSLEEICDFKGEEIGSIFKSLQ